MDGANTYVITNSQARRTCTLAGMSAAKEQRVSFEVLRNGIDIALGDLEAQRKSDDFYNSALMIARFSKATCDAFIALAAELSGNEKFGAVYGAAANIAEATATAAIGGKPNYAEVSTSIVKAASESVNGKAAKYLVKNFAVKTDILVGAMNADRKKIKKSAIEYFSDLMQFSLEALEAEKAAKFAAIAKETFAYNEAINEAIDNYFEVRDESIQRHIDLKATLQRQSRQIQKKVDDLNVFLASCE